MKVFIVLASMTLLASSAFAGDGPAPAGPSGSGVTIVNGERMTKKSTPAHYIIVKDKKVLVPAS